MPFFLKSREKAVAHSQRVVFIPPSATAKAPVQQLLVFFILSPFSQRESVLTIASARAQTGGVTHCECVSRLQYGISEGCIGAVDGGSYVKLSR